MTETINGLHSCKPGNDPVVGQVKLFVIQHMTSKKGKPYLKIKSANEENGGTPHRILKAEKTDFVDQHGNISFNIEVEASSSPATAGSTFQQTKAAMQQGEAQDYDPHATVNAPQSPVHAQQGKPLLGEPGYKGFKGEPAPFAPQSPPPHQNAKGDDRFAKIEDINSTRQHLMQSANLLVLCIRAVENAVAPHQPVVAQTSEQFQSDVAKLFIEASSRRTTDGVNWWSFIDKMPTTPLVPNGKAKPIQKEEDDEEFPPF